MPLVNLKCRPILHDHEPEVLDAGTLAAIKKGVKSLDEGEGVSVETVRPLVRERYQAWPKIAQDLRKYASASMQLSTSPSFTFKQSAANFEPAST
jgi:hypothetical protein